MGSPNPVSKRESPHPPQSSRHPPKQPPPPPPTNNENNLNRHNILGNGHLEHHHQQQPAHHTAPQPPAPFSMSQQAKQLLRVRRFLCTLHQFAVELSADTGARAQELIFGLVSSTYAVEEFLTKMQDLLHYPLRPYVLPFLRGHLPLLQSELAQLASRTSASVGVFVRQNPGLVLDPVSPHNGGQMHGHQLMRPLPGGQRSLNAISALSAELEQLCQESGSTPASSAAPAHSAQANPLKRRYSPDLQAHGQQHGARRQAHPHSPPAKVPAKPIGQSHAQSQLNQQHSLHHAQLTQARAAMLEELMTNGYQSQMAQQLNLVNQQLNAQIAQAQKARLGLTLPGPLSSLQPPLPPTSGIGSSFGYYADPLSPGRLAGNKQLTLDRLALLERYEKELMLQPNGPPMQTLQPPVSSAQPMPSPFVRNGLGRESCMAPSYHEYQGRREQQGQLQQHQQSQQLQQQKQQMQQQQQLQQSRLQALSPVPAGPAGRENEEEWKNIYTMLNCIMGMVEKTKCALNVLQQRSGEQPPPTPSANLNNGWTPQAAQPVQPALPPQPQQTPKRPAASMQNKPAQQNGGQLRPQFANSRLSTLAEVPEPDTPKRDFNSPAPLNLQKSAPSVAEKRAEIMSIERTRVEEMLKEVRRQTAEEVLAKMNRQEENNQQNCWNCGRSASETCSGCNQARYCGSFCQLKDWDTHLKVCGGGAGPVEKQPADEDDLDEEPLEEVAEEPAKSAEPRSEIGQSRNETSSPQPRSPCKAARPPSQPQPKQEPIDKSDCSTGISSTSRSADGLPSAQA